MAPTAHPRAILLDLDGTLADSLSAMRLAYRGFLKALGAQPTDSEFDSLNGPPLAEVVRRLKATHGLSGDEAMLLRNYIDAIDAIYANVVPRAGAVDLLDAARRNRCILAIVTSNSTKRAQAWLQTVGLSHLIDFIVSADDVQYGKPHPEPYLLASGRASCPRSMIIAVEDSPQGAQSAVGAGIGTFVLTPDVRGPDPWPAGVVPISSLNSLSRQLWRDTPDQP